MEADGLTADIPDLGSATLARNFERDADLPPGMHREVDSRIQAQHYATWPDYPLPALGGRTPRDTVTTKAGRATVDALIKEIEHHEARLPRDGQFDFSGPRRELGLSEGGST